MKILKIWNKRDSNYSDILIDDWNWDRVNEWNWCIIFPSGDIRIMRTNRPHIQLSNFIMNDNKNIYDHISRDPLDNREENLRICTIQQNSFNRGVKATNKSGYIGVSWDKTAKKWVAQIEYCGKGTKIGRFNDKIEAAKARDAKALELFGDFAVLNFS